MHMQIDEDGTLHETEQVGLVASDVARRASCAPDVHVRVKLVQVSQSYRAVTLH